MSAAIPPRAGAVLPALALALALALAAPPAAAEPILPEGRFPALDEAMARHARQFYTLDARPFGLSLNPFFRDEAGRAATP